jgi:hypothetical protein
MGKKKKKRTQWHVLGASEGERKGELKGKIQRALF